MLNKMNKNQIYKIIIRLVFCSQLGFFFYLTCGLTIFSIAFLHVFMDWIFWLWISAILLILMIFFLFHTRNRIRLWVIFVSYFLDVIFIFLGMLLTILTINSELINVLSVGIIFTFISILSIVLLSLNFKKIQKTPNETQGYKFFNRRNLIGIALIAFLGINTLLSYNGYNLDVIIPDTDNEIKISFWSHWNASGYSDELLNQLKIFNSSLYVFTPDHVVESQPSAFNDSMHRFMNYSIEIYLCATPFGDFSAIYNWERYRNKTLEIAQFIISENLTTCVKGFINDVESPHYFTDELFAFLNTGDLIGLGRYICNSANSQEYLEAVQGYGLLNDELQALGFETHITAMLQGLIDIVDYDTSVQSLLQYAAFPPYNYDIYNVMLYRSIVEGDTYLVESNPYFTSSYIKLMKHKFGTDAVSISLGVVNQGVYQDFNEIVTDVKICKDMGVKEVVIFKLQGTHGLTGAFGYNTSAISVLNNSIYVNSDTVIRYERSATLSQTLIYLLDLLI